jgi:hypothetical protein
MDRLAMPKLTPIRATMLRALAKRTDPIFPAIEAHRAAWKAYTQTASIQRMRRSTRSFERRFGLGTF